jgi:hypothetical protein
MYLHLLLYLSEMNIFFVNDVAMEVSTFFEDMTASRLTNVASLMKVVKWPMSSSRLEMGEVGRDVASTQSNNTNL